MDDSADDRAAKAALPARPGRVVGIAGALLVIVLAFLWLFREPTSELDPTQALAPHFAPGELPFGFRPTSALELSTGEVVVRIENDDPRAETEEVEAPDEGDDADEDGDEDDRPDPEEFRAARRERHASEDGTPPTDVRLVRYPRAAAEAALARHLRRHAVDDDRPQLDETITIDGGHLPWGRYDADFVHERDYDEGGHFTDVLRVNLTRGSRCWILFVEWPRDYRGSRAPVEALLEALPPGEE